MSNDYIDLSFNTGTIEVDGGYSACVEVGDKLIQDKKVHRTRKLAKKRIPFLVNKVLEATELAARDIGMTIGSVHHRDK